MPFHHTRATHPSSFAHGNRSDWEPGFYRIKKVIRHKVVKRSSEGEDRLYEVEWDGVDPTTGQAWPNWWVPGEDLTPDVLAKYEERRGMGVPSVLVSVDVAIVFKLLRRSIAHALMFGAVKNSGIDGVKSRNRPRVHRVHVNLAQLEPVALGLLDVARKHGGPALKLTSGNVDAFDAWWQLTLKELPRIAAFCEFQSFLEVGRAVDNVRLVGTSKHSGDMVAIGQPIVFTVKRVAHTPGVVDSYVEFPTVHFNGATGQPTYPHMGSGMLTARSERAKLIRHVRDRLPKKHQLREKGWCALPDAVSALAIEMAVPDEPKANKAKSGARAKKGGN